MSKSLYKKNDICVVDSARFINGSIEFYIQLEGQTGHVWIDSSEICKPTLRSNIFMSFYHTIGQNITNLSQLINHLSKNNNQEESLSNCSDAHVDVDFGNKVRSFSKHRLQKMSFFRTKFSPRCIIHDNAKNHTNDKFNNSIENDDNEDDDNNDVMQIDSNNHHDDAIQTIYIFGANNDNYNNSNSTQCFGSNELELLLQCFEHGHIPYDIEPESNALERLVLCGEYLTCSNDAFIMNSKTLINYFDNCRHTIDFDSRKKLVANVKHPLLSNALKEWDNEIHGILNNQQQNIATNCNVANLSKIKFDATTAEQLFVHRFKVLFETSDNNYNSINNNTTLRINILHFTKQEDYINLYRQCNQSSNGYVEILSIIADIVDKIIHKYANVKRIGKITGCPALFGILENVNQSMIINENTNAQAQMINLDLISLVKALLILTKKGRVYICDPTKSFQSSISHLSKMNNANSLSQIVPLIVDILVMNSRNDFFSIHDVSIDDGIQVRQQWLSLLKFCLTHCNQETICNTTQIWFPVLFQNETDIIIDANYETVHRNEIKSNNDFIFNSIVPKLRSKYAVTFATQLSYYFMCGRNVNYNDKYATKYFEIIRKYTGWQWEIIRNEFKPK